MEGNSGAPHDIENPHIPLATLMRRKLDGLIPLSASRCIYKVSEALRCVNEKAYTPRAVSIGPIHHGKEGLEDMEEHKMRYLRYFLYRTGVDLEDCVMKLKGQEEELRSCYADTGLSSDEFVSIILVDAAFIIELLLRHSNAIVPDRNDRIFRNPWLINIIRLDMLLLENQLPFFILVDLYATVKVPSLFELSYNFCKVSTSFYVKGDYSRFSSFHVEHFVDLFRTLHLPTEEENSKYRASVKILAIPSLTKLHQAGVKFKARSNTDLFDICFKDGILEIPNLKIDERMEPLLRNLIAFEQRYFYYNYFSDYIFLMDNFVNTPDDVELLVKNGIVENLLGDNNEVSTLINSLGKGMFVNADEFYYATLTNGLNEYYKKNTSTLAKKWKANWRSTWKAKLKQNCFDTPWRTISVIAATLIIILTFIQTVCSISQCAQR